MRYNKPAFLILITVFIFSGMLFPLHSLAAKADLITEIETYYDPDYPQKIVSGDVTLRFDRDGIEIFWDDDSLGHVEITEKGNLTVSVYDDGTYAVRLTDGGTIRSDADDPNEYTVSDLKRAEKKLEELQKKLNQLETIEESLEEPAKLERPARPKKPARPDTGNRYSEIVRFGSSVTIDEDDIVEGSVVVFGGSINNNGFIDQDMVCIGGSLTNNGFVDGDAVCIGGSLSLGPNAHVNGDAVSVGGSLQRADGAFVDGEVVTVGAGEIFSHGYGDREWTTHLEDGKEVKINIPKATVGSRIGDFFWTVFFTLAVIAITVLLIVFFPNYMNATAQIARHEFWKALVIGIVSWIALIPIMVIAMIILSITCIGVIIPPILFVVLILLSYAIVGLAFGMCVNKKFDLNLNTDIKTAVIGVIALHLLWLLGNLVAIPGWLSFVGNVIAFFGLIIVFFGITVGMGAVVMSKAGNGRHTVRAKITIGDSSEETRPVEKEREDSAADEPVNLDQVMTSPEPTPEDFTDQNSETPATSDISEEKSETEDAGEDSEEKKKTE